MAKAQEAFLGARRNNAHCGLGGAADVVVMGAGEEVGTGELNAIAGDQAGRTVAEAVQEILHDDVGLGNGKIGVRIMEHRDLALRIDCQKLLRLGAAKLGGAHLLHAAISQKAFPAGNDAHTRAVIAYRHIVQPQRRACAACDGSASTASSAGAR